MRTKRTEKEDDFLVSVHAVTNKRPYMEDRHTVSPSLVAGTHLLAVYDGHGGDAASSALAREVPRLLREALARGARANEAIKLAVARADGELPVRQHGALEPDCGSTLCLGVLQPAERAITVANVGDSRMVMKTRGGMHALTRDHNLQHAQERRRIAAAGGAVMRDMFGVERIGGLNMSRSLGDRSLRPFVSPHPVVSRYRLEGCEEYVVLGTDGLWDVMSNKDAMYVTDRHLDDRGPCRSLRAHETVAHELVREAVARGSTDNITAVWASWAPPAQR